jgi:intracellular septation protein
MSNYIESLKPLVTDLASTLTFAILLACTNNLTLATSVSIALGVAQIAVARLRERNTSRMQQVGLALIVVLGLLTLYLHDARFMMAKFTIVHVAIGSVMLERGWMRRYMPKIVTDNLSDAAIVTSGAIWSALMFALAAANLYIGLEMSPRVWATFLAVAPTGAPLTLFALQSLVIRARVLANIRKRSALQAA